MRVTGIFTSTTISPGGLSRQCPNHYAIRAGQNLPEADARAAADSTASKALSALEQTVTKSKLCRIKYGSYTGNGKSGKANPNTLSCDFYPVLLIISKIDEYSNITRAVAIRGVSKFGSGAGNRLNINTWSERSVSWYSETETDTYYNAYDVQLNTSGIVYQYLILGYDQ